MTTETSVGLATDRPQATFRAFAPATEAGHRYNVQLVLTADTVGKLVTNVQDLTAVLDKGGWEPAYGFAGPAGQGNGHAGHVPAPAPQAAPSVVPGAPKFPEEPGVQGWSDVDRIVVGPMDPTGKVRIDFFNDARGLKFPVEYATRPSDQIAGLLSTIGLTVEPSSHTGFLARVHYTVGRQKPNSEKHYHDITRLELLPPA